MPLEQAEEVEVEVALVQMEQAQVLGSQLAVPSFGSMGSWTPVPQFVLPRLRDC